MKNQWASIIIPTYNRADFITQSLDSVWEQTYRPIEVLIVDDGSTDNTKEVVAKWKKEHETKTFTTKYIYQENSGAPTARNTGIDHSTGRYLQFLDSDDLLMPEKLTSQIDVMKREKTLVCVCDYSSMDENGNIISRASNDRPMQNMISDYIYLSTIIGVIDKSVLENYQIRWNPKLHRAQDKDFYIKIFMLIDSFSYVNKDLFMWVRHTDEGISSSTKASRKVHWDVFKSIVKFNVNNYRYISHQKIKPIMTLYAKLLYTVLGIGRITPEFLKFWK